MSEHRVFENLKEKGARSDIDLGSTKSWRLQPSSEARLYGDGIGR